MNRTIIFFSIILFIFSIGLLAQQQTSDGGYIIAGSSNSYSNGMSDFLVYKLDAAGAKEWRKNFGGVLWDDAVQIQQTTDGGYIVAGITGSYAPAPGSYCDFLLYKLNAAGNKAWRKNFGGGYCDHAFGVIQTSDGGYLVIGDTSNYVHGTPNNDNDFLVYKLDAAGNKQWRKNYGGIQTDYGVRAVQTSDGGYMLIGYSESYTNGMNDFLVYKVDASGAKLWRKNFGGSASDYGLFVRQTSDGGYILCGKTYSYVHFNVPGGTKLGPAADILVYRLDASGNKLWRKNYGGNDQDKGFDIRQTPDGGYVFCGLSSTYTNGEDDMLVYRVDAAGAKLWRKNYGGTFWDDAKYIAPTSDGGFMIFGNTATYTNGGSDFLVYKIDASGTKLWRKNFGGSNGEWINVDD